MESHPDKTGDTAAFLRVKEAFEVLSNPDLRRQYDRLHSTQSFVNRPQDRPRPAASWLNDVPWETMLWSVVGTLSALWLVRPLVASSPPLKPANRPQRAEPRGAEPQPREAPTPARRSARLKARSALVFEAGMLPTAGTPSSLGRFVIVVMAEEDACAGAAWEWVQKAADAIRPEMRVVWGTTSRASCGAGRVAELAASRGVRVGAPYAMSVQLRGGRVVTAAKPLDAGVVDGQWAAGPALLAWCERVVGGEVRHLAA